MRVIVRAWNKDGYHRDIAVLSEQQVHMHHIDVRTDSPMIAPPIGVAVTIDPLKFPEMTEFTVIIPIDQKG